MTTGMSTLLARALREGDSEALRVELAKLEFYALNTYL
jgi:hypothetical protein